jgi:Uma2 family endonuclease
VTTQATLPRPIPRDEPGIPPLLNGDHLSREEFERRWDLHPEIKLAELIRGVVFVETHVNPAKGQAMAQAIGNTAIYAIKRPECEALAHATVRLGEDSDAQPDVMLRKPARGTSIEREDVIEGAPEFVFEVCASSASFDLYEKKELYREFGVIEYVVWQLYENRLDWFRLENGEYVTIAPDADGVIESVTFPGLRLPVAKLLDGDAAGVVAALR